MDSGLMGGLMMVIGHNFFQKFFRGGHMHGEAPIKVIPIWQSAPLRDTGVWSAGGKNDGCSLSTDGYNLRTW